MPSLLQETYQDFIETFNTQNEEKIVSALNLLTSQFSCKWDEPPLNDSFSAFTFKLSHGKTYTGSILFYAVFKGYKKVVHALLKADYPIDAGTQSSYPDVANMSALMMALETDQQDMVADLLTHQANLLHISDDGRSILMRPVSSDMLINIVKPAVIKGCLLDLLTIKDNINQSIFDYFQDNKALRLAYLALGLTVNLGLVIAQKNEKAVEKTLQLGLQISSDFVKKLEPRYFFEASAFGYAKSVQLFLENGFDYLQTAENKQPVLMLIDSAEICRIIIDKATKDNNLYHLLQLELRNGNNAFTNACLTGRLTVLDELMAIENYSTFIDMSLFLHTARIAYWRFPDKREAFANICDRVRPFVQVQKQLTDIEKNALGYNFSSAFKALFGKDPANPTELQTKQAALEIAMGQFYALLANPLLCVPYFRHLDQELARYFEETYQQTFPSLDKDSYEFKAYDGLYLPIPKLNYQGISKYSTLQAVLICALRQAGVAEKCYKWIGFIPYKLAKEMNARGDFFTDDRLSTGLFHGKIAHMLQQWLLLCAFQNGDINLSYTENNIVKQLTFKDLIAAHMDLRLYDNNQFIWTRLRDGGYKNYLTNSHPHRLMAMLMDYGHKWGIPNLASYLIDTFCKGFKQFLAMKNSLEHLALTSDDFVLQLQDVDMVHFSDSKAIINYALNHQAQKNQVDLNTDEKNYAVIEKNYVINTQFKPKPYQTEGRFFNAHSTPVNQGDASNQSKNTVKLHPG